MRSVVLSLRRRSVVRSASAINNNCCARCSADGRKGSSRRLQRSRDQKPSHIYSGCLFGLGSNNPFLSPTLAPSPPKFLFLVYLWPGNIPFRVLRCELYLAMGRVREPGAQFFCGDEKRRPTEGINGVSSPLLVPPRKPSTLRRCFDADRRRSLSENFVKARKCQVRYTIL